MPELLEQIGQLRKLDPGVHWFCNKNEGRVDENEPSALHKASAQDRRSHVFECIMVFSFDGASADEPKSVVKDGITRNLLRCEDCLSEYYRAKKRMLDNLREEGYEDEQVDTFAGFLDDHAIERISRGLKRAMDTLREVPETQRRPGSLSRSTLMAMREVLYCERFMNDDGLMSSLFDEPFRLCQTAERLSLKDVAPALITFAFGEHNYRRDWALIEWRTRPSIASKDEFDFALRPGLMGVLHRATPPVQDFALSAKFWDTMKDVVAGLEPGLITHGLRTMSVDACKLTIDYLNFDQPTFKPLLQTITAFLRKTPRDYWDAMGAIAPHSIIEGIFHNAMYDRIVDASGSGGEEAYDDFQALVGWVRPFMESVQSSNQPPSCRQLANQFLQRLQDRKFPERARTRCYEVGLNVLKWVILIRLQTGTASDAVSRAVATDLLHIVDGYLDEIIRQIEHSDAPGSTSDAIRDLCQDVIQAALTLECRLLRIDHETLAKGNHLNEGSKKLSLSVWKKVVPHISARAVRMAKAALPATTELSDLGQFGPKGPSELADERERFNGQFMECVELMSRAFENISDMEDFELKAFVHDDKIRPAIVAALLSSETSLYDAALAVVKSMSDTAVREEAIRFMLEPRLPETLDDFSEALATISSSRNFYPCRKMIRTASDILIILCDPQDGLLRQRDLDRLAKQSVSRYWRRQWQVLTTIYECTERWSVDQDRSMMKEFCRDTMEFSSRLFNEFAVFESANDTADTGDNDDEADDDIKLPHQQLLTDPSRTMESMVKWLRLRDDFLAATAVDVIKKLIDQLQKAEMGIPSKVNVFLEGVVNDNIKTVLSAQQKAEITKALGIDDDRDASDEDELSENRQDRSEVSKVTPRGYPVSKSKTGTLDAWWARARSGESPVVDLTDSIKEKDEPLEKYSKTLTSAMGKVKTMEREKAAKLVQRKVEERRQSDQAKQASFLEKRQREQEERKRKDAATAARLRAQNPNSLAGQTAGAGSALNGLGNLGRDHSVKKGTGMMLSSDDDSGSDDDDDGGLFGPSKAPKYSANFKDIDAQRRQNNQQRGPVKKIKQARSKADMRARLVPNLAPLHRIILSWDLFQGGDFPPGTSRADYRLVTNSFRTPQDYQRTFEPLLRLEAWQGFQQQLEEGTSKSFAVQVASRLSVDSLVEVSTSMELAEFQNMGLSESDIVILSQTRDTESAKARCLARLHKIGRRKATSIELSFRVSPENNSLLSKLSANADIFGSKITSLTPLEREYSALSGLQYYDLCDEIIKAVPSPKLDYAKDRLAKICRMYDLNAAQAKAVNSAVDNDAFTLIQGPPGSGKTKTIVSIVGALLTEVLRKSSGAAVPLSKPTTQGIDQGVAAKKLLVCAPSNAAVDELVMRLMGGVKTFSGDTHKINVIRLGKSDRINPKVAAVTLDVLVTQQMNAAAQGGKEGNEPSEMTKMMENHKQTSETIKTLRARLDAADSENRPKDHDDLLELEKMRRLAKSLSIRIDELKDSGNTRARDAEIRRRKIQQQVLDSAHVLCATLSGSGHDMFQSLKIDFETVIIDEAAQSVELSALIPLKYGCQKCIMVGDPKQLPPTVLSREAARFQYEQSLFVRMQDNRPEDVHLLDTQYRMHPEISRFPSTAFYDGKLLDGASMRELRTKFWHEDPLLGPYRFFNVQGQHQTGSKGHSLINRAEIEVAVQLYTRLTKVAKSYNFDGKVGIITPYKGQLQQLRDRFKRQFGEEIFKIIEFNTTDAFQGRESEVIIFSCVRASAGGIGFLTDIRRMNVGITRAKCSLWVLGNVESLQRGEYWKRMIVDARDRQLITEGDVQSTIKQNAKQLADSKPELSLPVGQVRDGDISPTSPIDVNDDNKGNFSDAMEIDAQDQDQDQDTDTTSHTEKRKRDLLDLDSGHRGKSPRTAVAAADTASADTEDTDQSTAKPPHPDRKGSADNRSDSKPKRAPPAARPPVKPPGIVRPEKTSVFMKKPSKKK